MEDLYSGEPHEVSVVISSCADLAVVQPRLEGCRDDRAVWVEDPDSRIFQPVLGAVPLQAPPDYAAGPDADPDRDPGPGPVVAEVEVAEVLALPARIDSIENRQVVDTVLVPRALLTGDELAELSVLGSRATVVADPRHDLAGELRAVGVDAFSGWDVAEFERLQRYIDTVRLLTVVVLALGLASFLLGMVDRVLERRAELSRLRLLGTPVSTLRAAHWLEVAVPLVLGCGLALVLGGAIGTAYLDLVHATTPPPERRHLSWTYLLGVASAAGIGCLLVAAATSLGLGGRPRPDLVRQA